MRQTVFGIFDTANEAQTAVKKLMEEGFTREAIDVHRTREEINTTSSETHHKSKSNEYNSDGYRNFFSNLFADDDDQIRKHSEVASRGSVVTVHTNSPEESERAAQIMDRYGAIDVNERARQYQQERSSGTNSTGQATSSETIPVIEEEMEIGKREVETGKVQIRSRIIERPVEETLRLREEHVNVERTPVNRPATEADFQNFKEGETEIIEHAEKAIVNKEARVVEEVNLHKDTKDRERIVRDTVRKTDVDVDRTTNDEEKKER